MKKRIIALLLCAAMLCGMVLTSGFDASSILADVQTAVAAAETEPEATPAPTAAPLDEVTQIVESVVTATYSETAPVLTGEPENGCYIDSDNNGTFDEDEKYATLDLAIAAANDMTFGEDAEKTVTIGIYGKMEYTNDTAGFTGSYTTINFVGKDTDAEISITRAFPNGENKDGGFIVGSGKNITFKDLILSKSEGTYGDGGQLGYCFSVHNGGIVSYTNCTFPNGAGVGSGTKTTYTGCTFKESYEKYALWTYGNSVCVVDTCVFDDDRGIKMFSDDDSQENWCDITVKNCDFSKLTGKPAIVLTKGKSVTLQGNTYSNKGVFELEDNGSSNGTIVKVLDVDGNDITATADIACLCENGTGTLNVDCGALVLHEGTYTIYRTIEDAAKVAVSGDTIIALYSTSSTDEEVTLREGVILNANGHSLPNVTGGVVPVAKIGDTYYSTLEAAIGAVKDEETITLLSDVVITKTLDVSSVSDFEKINITIDGGGYTIKAADSFNTQASKWLADVAWNVDLKNITFDANKVSDLRGVQFYTSKSSLTDVTIKNVIGASWSDYAIHNNASDLTINSLTFVDCKMGGHLYLDRGESIGDAYQTKLDVSNAMLNGVVLVVTDPAATVTLGSTKWVTENSYVLEPYDTTVAVAKIEGNENIFYKSLSAAVNAANDDATITLLANIELNSEFDIPSAKKITLDLAGHDITSSYDTYTIDVNSGAELTILGTGTIKNTSGNSTVIRNYGKLTIGKLNEAGPTITRGDSDYETNSAVKCEETATLTIYSGTFGGDKRSIQSWGTTTIYGGTFEKTVEAWEWTTSEKVYDSTLNIYGGSFAGEVTAHAEGNANNMPTIAIIGGMFTQKPAVSMLAADYAAIKPDGEAMYSIVPARSATITIGSDDGICTITGNGFTTKVVLVDGTQTVKLPVGTYTVSLDTSWGWRYKNTQSGTLTVSADGTNSCELTTTRNNQWFSGTAAKVS